MKLLMSLWLALIAISPALAQQRQRAPQSAVQPAAPSGWTIPARNFPEAFNRLAGQLQFDIRAVETECRDTRTPVFTCGWRAGRYIPGYTVAREDRTSARAFEFSFNPNDNAAGAAELMSVVTVLMTYLEPTADRGQRGAAFTALFPQRRSSANLSTEARLGETRFSILILPGVQIMASVRRADDPD